MTALPTNPTPQPQPKPERLFQVVITYLIMTILLVVISYLGLASAENFWPFSNSAPQFNLQGPTNYAYLKQSGTKVLATIMNVVQDTKLRENYQSPYQIEAQWTDPATSKTYVFYSDPIGQDPSFLLRNTTSIVVYVDPTNYTHYYVDLSSVGL